MGADLSTPTRHRPPRDHIGVPDQSRRRPAIRLATGRRPSVPNVSFAVLEGSDIDMKNGERSSRRKPRQGPSEPVANRRDWEVGHRPS